MNLDSLDDITNVTDEELATLYMEMKLQDETLVAGMKMIRDEFLDRMDQRSVDGISTEVAIIGKANILSYGKVSLDTARDLGAIVEGVDTVKLKTLFKSGVEIAGLEQKSYARITEME